MSSFVTTSPRLAGRRGWSLLCLALPMIALGVAQSTALPVNGSYGCAIPPVGRELSPPYLRFVGPPPLRFQEALPPPDVSVTPPTSGPPRAGLKLEADIVPPPAKEPSAKGPTAPRAAPVKTETTEVKSTATLRSPNGPAALLPDDASQRVRPEDFLPFFEFPGGRGSEVRAGGPPVPQTPGALPPSSATYQQQ